MAAPDFDFQSFAQDLAGQAVGLVPEEFNEEQKQYVVNTLGNFAMMAGQALAQDPNLNFSADISKTITQIIAEWAFHKSVDVIRSGIPQQYWDNILQKIAFEIFKTAQETFSQGLQNDQILDIIDQKVKETYNAAIQELKDSGAIDQGTVDMAKSQSNIDKMAEQMKQTSAQEQQALEAEGAAPSNVGSGQADLQEEFTPQASPKILKLATLALLLKKMNVEKAQNILDKLETQDAQDVVKYMGVADLQQRVGINNALQCLKEIKTSLPKSTEIAPNKVVLKIKKSVEKYSSNELDTMLARERIGVKRLVYNALEGKYYEKMSPKVASIVATHLADSV